MNQLIEQLFDAEITRHGYLFNQRDYAIVAHPATDAANAAPMVFSFSHCVVANCVTVLKPDAWRAAWDNTFLDYEKWKHAGAPEGHVWASGFTVAYPGPRYVEASALAAHWSDRLERQMYEARVETYIFQLQLVFFSLEVRQNA